MSEWQSIRVTIRMGDPVLDDFGLFEAYTTGDDWNGWVTPYFTEAQGKRIARWTRMLKEKIPDGEVESVYWDETRGMFILESPEDPHEPDEPIPAEDLVEGIWVDELNDLLYGIGAYRWTWELAEVPVVAQESS